MKALQEKGYLDNLEWVVVDPEGDGIQSASEKIPVYPLDYIHEYKPDRILIVSESNAIRVYEKLIEEYAYSPLQVYLPKQMWNERWYVEDERFQQIVQQVPASIPGGLSCPEVTIHLYDALKCIVRKEIPGAIVNLGVYQGWSLYFIGLVLRELCQSNRAILGFDSFAGFSKTGSPKDVFCDYQCQLGKTGWNFYKNTDEDTVANHVADFDTIQLIAGDIKDTIHQLKDVPIALALFDMDDYTPTCIALPTVYEQLSPGGIMIHDHYSYPTLCEGATVGQKLAMDEFMQTHPMFHLTGTNVFVK